MFIITILKLVKKVLIVYFRKYSHKYKVYLIQIFILSLFLNSYENVIRITRVVSHGHAITKLNKQNLSLDYLMNQKINHIKCKVFKVMYLKNASP